MADTDRPPTRPRIPATGPTRARPALRGARDLGSSLVAGAATFAALGLLFLFPYAVHHFRYPLGWDAAATVRQARAVEFDGLARIGGIRAGSPLLLATLARATGQNAFTLVAVVPAILAGVGGLGAAAMARASVRISALWAPVIGFLTWAAFGGNGMMNLHLDNLLNSALTLAGFGALIAYAAGGRGLVATALLLGAAGLAHWPFFAVAAAVYAVAVAGFVLPGLRTPEGRTMAVRLLAPLAVSGAFVASTFLAIPASGWLGARLGALSSSLRKRFLEGLHEAHRYWAIPVAALGALGVARTPTPPARPQARRLFLLVMGSWILVTVLACLAQWAGVPTAGGRLLMYLFPIPILAAMFVWWGARWLAAREPAVLWRMAAAGLVVAAIGGFGALTAGWRATQRPWIDPILVQQVTWSAAYLEVAAVPLDRPLVYLLGASLRGRPSIQVVRASLPPDRAARAFQTYSSPADYLSRAPSSADLPGPPGDPVVLVLQKLGPKGFDAAVRSFPKRVVGPGVLILQGPMPNAPLPPAAVPAGPASAWDLAWASLAVLALLFVAGGGWSLALVPADWILRVALAPALGIALTTLLAFAWDRIGLPLTGAFPLIPLGLATLAGWALAGWSAVRSRGPSDRSDRSAIVV